MARVYFDQYFSMSKSELDKFYNSQFEPMEFPWLDNIKKMIETNYDVKVMTITLKIQPSNLHLFRMYVEKFPDATKQVLSKYKKDEILEEIYKYYNSVDKEDIKFSIFVQSFEDRAKEYLTCTKSYEYKEIIASYFDYLFPVCMMCYNSVYICTLGTKEEAKRFLMSQEYGKIRNQIYDLLKPFDDYDVLRLEDIRMLVDYEEHKLTYPDNFYIQCLGEWNDEQINEHHESIINGE